MGTSRAGARVSINAPPAFALVPVFPWPGNGWVLAGAAAGIAVGLFVFLRLRHRRRASWNCAPPEFPDSEPKPFDPWELVATAASLASAEAGGLAVETAISPAVPRQLIGAPNVAGKILREFAGHASRFPGRRRVNLTVWCKTGGSGSIVVFFAVFADGPELRPDRPGIPAAGLESGSAPDLAPCEALAKLIDGRVWLEREPGGEFCLCFSAPFAVAGATTRPDSSGSQAADSGAVTADRFANLRQLAIKKQTSFAGELSLFFSEFDAEFSQLTAALQREDARQSGHYVHLLYGRCAFVGERRLESMLRKIEAAIVAGNWQDARRLSGDIPRALAEWRISLKPDAPAVPPGSDR